MVKQGRGKKGAAAAAVAAWKEAGKFAAQSGKMKLQQTFGLRSTRWRRRAESVGKGEGCEGKDSAIGNYETS